MRLEKGYRAWGSDITPNDNPFEAGLGWAVKLKSNIRIHGTRGLRDGIAHAPLPKKLAGFTTEDPAIVLVGRETILRDGKQVGYLTSGGYGYTIGKPIGYGYVRNGGGVDDDYMSVRPLRAGRRQGHREGKRPSRAALRSEECAGERVTAPILRFLQRCPLAAGLRTARCNRLFGESSDLLFKSPLAPEFSRGRCLHGVRDR